MKGIFINKIETELKLMDSELTEVVGGRLHRKPLKQVVSGWLNEYIAPVFAGLCVGGAIVFAAFMIFSDNFTSDSSRGGGSGSIFSRIFNNHLEEFGDSDSNAIKGSIYDGPVSQERQWDGYRCGAHALRNLMLGLGIENVQSASELYTDVRNFRKQVTQDIGLSLSTLKDVPKGDRGADTSPLLSIDEIRGYIQQRLGRDAFVAQSGNFGSNSTYTSTVENLINHLRHPVILNLGGSHWVAVTGYQEYADGHVNLFIKDSNLNPVEGKSYNRTIRCNNRDEVLTGFISVEN